MEYMVNKKNFTCCNIIKMMKYPLWNARPDLFIKVCNLSVQGNSCHQLTDVEKCRMNVLF